MPPTHEFGLPPFRHALYHQVWYERVPAGRCSRLHRRIGIRTEQAYGERAGELAAALAMHFERGRDARRAVHYCRQAAENAARRLAYREVTVHLTTALTRIKEGSP